MAENVRISLASLENSLAYLTSNTWVEQMGALPPWAASGWEVSCR